MSSYKCSKYLTNLYSLRKQIVTVVQRNIMAFVLMRAIENMISLSTIIKRDTHSGQSPNTHIDYRPIQSMERHCVVKRQTCCGDYFCLFPSKSQRLNVFNVQHQQHLFSLKYQSNLVKEGTLRGNFFLKHAVGSIFSDPSPNLGGRMFPNIQL